MVFNVEDRILVENLYKFKGYRAKKIVNFLNGLKYQISTEETERHRTGTKARQPGSGRRQSARTAKNVDTVNDLVLSHKGALKCIKPRVKLQWRPVFITRQCTAFNHQDFQ